MFDTYILIENLLLIVLYDIYGITLLQVLLFTFLKMAISRSILDPRKKKQDFFLFFHLNVNNILARNKLSLLEAYNTIYKYDILCISETYLDSSVSVDDTTLSLPGYSLVRSDHLTMLKRGGVCMYFKENLSLRSINVPFLSQCVLCEMTLQSQKGYVIVIY